MTKQMSLIVVFDCNFERMLLCKRMREPWKGKYNFIGGKLEPGEDMFHCADRELYEETGIPPQDRTPLRNIMELKYYWNTGEPEHLYVYSTVLKRLFRDVKLKEEVNPLVWFPVAGTNIFDVEGFAGYGNIGHILLMTLGRYFHTHLSDVWSIDNLGKLYLNYGAYIRYRNTILFEDPAEGNEKPELTIPTIDKHKTNCVDDKCMYLEDRGINGGLYCTMTGSDISDDGSPEVDKCCYCEGIKSCITCAYAGDPNVYETGTLDGIGYTCTLQDGKEVFQDVTPLLDNFSGMPPCPINSWKSKS